MKEYKNLIYEEKDNKVYLYLNRPESRNAISLALLTDLEECITEIENKPSIHILVIGAKGKAFCAGADLKERKTMDKESVCFKYISKVFDFVTPEKSCYF